ncbi:MAG: hypothetical protein KatS3mg124_2207 [Porticoccaceae bacterium]|nr:MAG: hypothetical protein KatS3mg124_2207 [Porticoccaceae bacterium]
MDDQGGKGGPPAGRGAMPPRRGLGIASKLALVAALPVALAAGALAWHTLTASKARFVAWQEAEAEALAAQLAAAAAPLLAEGRPERLRPLVETAASLPGVAAVRVRALDGGLLAAHPPPALTAGPPPARSFHRAAVAGPEGPVGEVEVAISPEPPPSLRDLLLADLLIAVAFLVVAAACGLGLAARLAARLRAMAVAVGELARGNLEARVEPRGADELTVLANALNHLAQVMAEERRDWERRLARATAQLRTALEELDAKGRALEEARRQAAQADNAKREFLAHMSHELRTPLTAIRGFVSLLAEAGLGAHERRYCEVIRQAADQLLALIDDILDATRLQAGAVILEEAPFHLAEAVDTPLALMAPAAYEKGLELVLDCSPGVPARLVGDCLRVRQILYNLLSNAIKFTPAGLVAVAVDVRPREPGGLWLILRVRDTGIGIPERDQARLFQPFRQLDGSIARRFGGTGLGLYIVRRLVELMGGTLSLDSAPGRGSCFAVELPLRAAEEAKPPPRAARVVVVDRCLEGAAALERRLLRYAEVVESASGAAELDASEVPADFAFCAMPAAVDAATFGAELADIARRAARLVVLVPPTAAHRALWEELCGALPGAVRLDKPPPVAALEELFAGSAQTPAERRVGGRVLVAEDNDFTRQLLEIQLARLGLAAEVVADGRQLLARAAEEPFDLVILDLHMPGLSGLETLRALRAGGGPNRSTPVVVLTADVARNEERALFAAGAADLLFKPVDEARLLACLRRHLPAVRAGAPGPAALEVHREAFAREVERLARCARGAFAGGDRTGLREAVHQLLGIAGVFRAASLARAVRALHAALASGAPERVEAALATLDEEVAELFAGN